MSAFVLIASALPPKADVAAVGRESPLLTRRRHSSAPSGAFIVPGSARRASPGSRGRGTPTFSVPQPVPSHGAGRRSSPGSWPIPGAPVPGPFPRSPEIAGRAARPRHPRSLKSEPSKFCHWFDSALPATLNSSWWQSRY